MRLFLKRGFDNVTMRNLASEIGYSPGAVYRYFSDKGEIFFALREEGFARFRESQLAARSSTDPRTRLLQHARAYVTFALDNREYYELMFLMRAPINRARERAEWRAPVASLDLLREDVRLALEQGLFETTDPESAVFALWSFLHGLVALLLRQRLDLHSDRADRQLTNQVIDFIDTNLIAKEKP